MAGLKLSTELTKGCEFPWMTDTYIWRDDAACLFSDPSQFEVDELRRMADEEKKFASAKETCGLCPVRAECLEDASREDLMFTMRGGLLPLRHQEMMGVEIEPDDSLDHEAIDKEPCPKGHDMWFRRTDGKIRCRQCKRDADNARAQLKREGSYPLAKSRPRDSKMAKGEPCKRGHFDWVKYGTSKYYYCRTCKNLSRRGKL